MESKNKIFELVRHFVFYGISSALQSLIGFILLPLLTRHIPTNDFGAYSLMVFYTSLLSSFFYFGTTASLNRFYFSKDDDQSNKDKVISSNLLITIFGALFQFILSFIFIELVYNLIFPENKVYLHDFKILIVASTFGLLANYNLAVLRVLNKSYAYLIVNLLSSSVNIIFTTSLLVIYNLGIIAPIVGMLMGNIVLMGVTFLLIFNKIKIKLDLLNIKKCFIFGFSIIFLGLSFSFLDWVDRIILNRFTTLSDVGIYSFGYRIGILVYAFFSVPFSMAWSTIRMERLNTSNYNLFTSRVVTLYSIVGWSLVLIVSLFISEIIHFIGGNSDYYKSINIVPIILSAYLIYGYVTIFDIGIFLSKKIKYYLISFAICIVLNVVFNIITIPLFGFIASAFVTLFTYIAYIYLIFSFSNKFLKIDLDYYGLIKVVLPVASVLILNDYFQLTSISNSLIVFLKLSIIAGYIFYLWNSVLLTEDKSFVFKIVTKISK